MDVSIKTLKSYVFEPKSPALREVRAKEIVSSEMVITEKVDGTKLTLVRTSEEDLSDYTKNWIVAYKGTILYAKEFSHIGDKEKKDISSKSVGIGQYALVFDHLKLINQSIALIPKSTEFSVEFAQNKDTLTRTYVNKGGMFLRSFGKVSYRIMGEKVYTRVIGGEVTDQNKVYQMAKKLNIAAFPLFHRGDLSYSSLSKNEFLVNNVFMSKIGKVDWSNSLEVLEKFSSAILEIPSVLGGRTEGVVMKLSDGRLFKIVQSDQYDQETRDQKKSQYRLDPETASQYYQKIRELIYKIFSQIDVDNMTGEEAVSAVNQYVAKNRKSLEKFFSSLSVFSGGKKTDTNILDDVHDTVRLLISKTRDVGKSSKSIGLLPIAGKPLHAGHWKLIELASSENNRVIVYTTIKDRVVKGQFPIKGEDFIELWNDVFIPELPKNVSVKFVDSPVRSVMHELEWLEQLLTKDKKDVPAVKLYSDKDDVESNFKDDDLKKYPEMLNSGKIKKVGVDRNSTVNISGTKMREFLQSGDKESFFKYLPPVSSKNKETIWSTLMKNKVAEEVVDPFQEFIAEVIGAVLLQESGASVASVNPKEPKTVFGHPAQATTKLKIVNTHGKDIHSRVSGDVKTLIYNLNEKVGFWKKNNPYIESGFVFNGSSQYLMDPRKFGVLSKYKDSFGDIDVIIPKSKLDNLKIFLDSIDDNNAKWTPTENNKLSNHFFYVGRTKSFNSIPDQLVTLWYYQPTKQVVQVDFEGDEMTIDPDGFEKPSEWTKFSKDSPWDDLTLGIKGLAGALYLRSLARATTVIDNAVVLTPGGVKRVEAGLQELTPKDVTNAAQHEIPSEYTLNTGGGGAGVRRAYKLVKMIPYNGKIVKALRFVNAQETKPDERITDIGEVFKIMFKRPPTAEEKASFRSFQGLLNLSKKYLTKNQIDLAVKRFSDVLQSEPLNTKELNAIKTSVSDILGRQI